MGMSFGFKVVPGVRVRVSSRGVRTSVGPRAARVHMGGGRTTVSSGFGPFTVSSSGGSSRARRSYGPTPAQLQRQEAAIARAQAAEDKWARIAELVESQRALLSAHLEVFPVTRRPTLEPPTWATPEQYLPEAESRQLAGVSRFDRAGRERARSTARAEAHQSAAAYNAWLDGQFRTAVAEAEAWWASLSGNDPDVVLQAVNEAFSDSASIAAALSVQGKDLSVVMIQPAVEELGDQKAALTPGGKPTIKQMSKTEQRQQWTACTLSRAVATLSEAFAVAPGIVRVHLAVVSQSHGVGDYRLVLAGQVDRPGLTTAQWPSVLDVQSLARAGRFTSELDRFGALKEIPTDQDADLRSLMAGLNGLIDTDEDVHDTDLGLSEPTPVLNPSPVSERQTTSRVTQVGTVEVTVQSSSSEPRRSEQVAQVRLPAQDGRPFELWGTRGSWANMRIAGTGYRQEGVLALLPRPTCDGVEVTTKAQLIPEPRNAHDRNAVACFINDLQVGYLPREDAARYHEPLAKLIASGRIPTVDARVWAREYEDWDIDASGRERTMKAWSTSISVALAEPHMLAPLNVPPPKPRAELPGRAHAKVTGTQNHLAHLLTVLGDRETGWVHATLEPQTIETARTTKTVIAVLISGRPVGTLTPQTSAGFLPVVEPLAAAGCHVVARAIVTGSPVSATVNLYAARAHDIGRQWFADVAATTGVDLR